MNAGIAALCFLAASSTSGQAHLGAPEPIVAAAQVDVPTPPAASPSAVSSVFSEAPSGDPYRIWFGSEYLLWWTKNSPMHVPLVTQGDTTNFAIVGAPGTRVLNGSSDVDYGAASGMRLSGGAMIAPGLSVGGSYFALERQSSNFSANSDGSGNPVLGQPIIDAVTGVPSVELVSVPNPGGIAGGLHVSTTSRFQGWDLNLAQDLGSDSVSSFKLLSGFRSLNLNESLTIDANFHDISGIPGGSGLTFLGVPDITGANFTTQDRFQANNQFYGGQIGGRYDRDFGRFFVSLDAKVALGETQELVMINGVSALTPPGGPVMTAPGGVLALPSNIGRHYQERFAVVPEGNLTVGMQVFPWMRVKAGYDFLYWSNVVRPGNQVNPLVNRFNVPTDQNFGTGTGPNQPSFQFRTSDYWAQGFNFGLEFRF